MERRLRAILSLRASRGARALAIGLLVCGAVLVARGLGWLVPAELAIYDTSLRARPALASPQRVAMVWITEREIARFGHPLPDGVLAAALSELLRHAPRAIGVDVFRDRPSGEGWDELGRVMLASPRVVIVEKLADEVQPGVAPPGFLPDLSQVGFADVPSDRDGVARRGLLTMWDADGRPHFSLSLQLALRALAPDGLGLGSDPEAPQWLRIGTTTLPPFASDEGGYVGADDGGYQLLIDYRRRYGSFPSATLSEVVEARFDPELVRDRVVLIGTASPSVKDNFQAPSGLLPGSDAVIYGAEHHAQAIDQLVRLARGESVPVRGLPEGAERLFVLACCLAGAFVAMRVRSPLSLLAALALGLGALFSGGHAALLAGVWLPVASAAAGGLASTGLVVAREIQRERSERLQAINLFGRFVSRKLVDRIWADRELFMEGDRPRPQRITITALLSDLSGYTSRSETTEPAEVMGWIGQYMDRMAYLVERYDGMVNDFLGDGLMASFGVPVASETEEAMDRDAIHAVECALAMGEALVELNDAWRRAGQPTARMRVGIFTGPAVVGAIGSVDRMKYAAVGNTVNTASRLESFDKLSFELDPEASPFRILVGEATHVRLRGRFETVCLGAHALKGKGVPITIHRVLGRKPGPVSARDEEAHPEG